MFYLPSIYVFTPIAWNKYEKDKKNYKRYRTWGFLIQTLERLSIWQTLQPAPEKWNQHTSCKFLIISHSFLNYFSLNYISSCSRRPVNPKKPTESFFLQLSLLRMLGLWAPDTDNKLTQDLYTMWSYFYRGFFLYTYTLTQIMFFKDVEDMMVSLVCNYLNLTRSEHFVASAFNILCFQKKN